MGMGQELPRGMKMPLRNHRKQGPPPCTSGRISVPKQEGSCQRVNAGLWTEMRLTQITEDEKEPQGPTAGLWARVTEPGRKGRLGSGVEGYRGPRGS